MNSVPLLGVPVFLHFIDRETAVSTAEEQRSESVDISILETLAVCHAGGMSINVHPLSIYCANRPRLFEYVSRLCSFSILSTNSHDRDMPTFISVRQGMYEGVADTVPIFFADSAKLEKLCIDKINQYSMTALIRSNIFSYTPSRSAKLAPTAADSDRSHFTEVIDTIQDAVYRHPDAAITTDNVTHYSNDNAIIAPALPAMRRVLSAFYNHNYGKENLTVTATGIPRFKALIDDYSNFPYLDLPVLRTVLESLGWSKAAPDGDDLLANYGSMEHRAFVDAMQAFLHACFEQASHALHAPPTSDTAPAYRAQLQRLVSMALLRAAEVKTLETRDAANLYRSARELIVWAATDVGRKWKHFAAAWEEALVLQNYVPPTGYANLDRRLRAIRDQLRVFVRIAESELREVLAVAAPLLNFAGQVVQDNIFKTGISESEFHERVRFVLRSAAGIGHRLEEHARAAGGITDLSVGNIRVELKSLPKGPMCLQDCKQFVEQASSYGLATGTRVSVLCVLDCSPKAAPPFPVEDGIGLFINQGSASPTAVLALLIQGNLPAPSSHSRA